MKKYNIPGLLLDGANKYNDPEIIKTWITVENVQELLQKHALCRLSWPAQTEPVKRGWEAVGSPGGH